MIKIEKSQMSSRRSWQGLISAENDNGGTLTVNFSRVNIGAEK
jgi:hypothetical protein